MTTPADAPNRRIAERLALEQAGYVRLHELFVPAEHAQLIMDVAAMHKDDVKQIRYAAMREWLAARGMWNGK